MMVSRPDRRSRDTSAITPLATRASAAAPIGTEASEKKGKLIPVAITIAAPQPAAAETPRV